MSSGRHTYRPRVHRQGLLITALSLAPSQLIGSAFNIWYNLSHIQPLLTPTQHQVFQEAIGVFNLTVYPAAAALWFWLFFSLRPVAARLLAEQTVPPARLLTAQRRVINLPWWSMLVAGIGWLLCIPVFLTVLGLTAEPLAPQVWIHLPISIIISMVIALTHGSFTIDLLSQRLLYPLFFRQAHPAEIAGAYPLTLRNRITFWALSASICPIASLLLLEFVPHANSMGSFSLLVGLLGMGFSLISAWMLSQLVVEPVDVLQQAARRVARGDLTVQITQPRGDEFGTLIDAFNAMVTGLRDKQHLLETFGRHVGEQAARQILQQDPGLGGTEQVLTVMFADLRNFTARCNHSTPQEIVALLNLFLADMVEIVEHQHRGMVNKFLGDGFMALFGVGEPDGDHATRAIASGQAMMGSLERLNQVLADRHMDPLAIGIGIHTGPAVVGSIGSPQRLEYTAIGSTVNIASRVEALTKTVGHPLLFTAATRAALPADMPLQTLPPQPVRGLDQPLPVFSLTQSVRLDRSASWHRDG